eukprot:6466768-Amphidinium_carterae.1
MPRKSAMLDESKGLGKRRLCEVEVPPSHQGYSGPGRAFTPLSPISSGIIPTTTAHRLTEKLLKAS